MGMGNNAGKASEAQEQAARQARAAYDEKAREAVDYAKGQYGQGRTDIETGYNRGQDETAAYRGAGKSALDAIMAGLGLSGSEAQAGITEKFRNMPGYQFALDEGRKQVERSGAARGMTQSGAMAKELNNYGQGMADQQYGKWIDRLAGIMSGGANMSQQSANNSMQMGNNLANMGYGYSGQIGNYLTGMGENAANAELAAGNARASGYLNQSNPWEGIGTLAGGAAGAYFGGPAGAQAGMAAGGAAGKSLGS